MATLYKNKSLKGARSKYQVGWYENGKKYTTGFSKLSDAKDFYRLKHGEQPPGQPRYKSRDARNKTGKVGVGQKYENGQLTYFTAWVTLDGKPKILSFSVTKYGKKVAYEYACACRIRWEIDPESVRDWVEIGPNGKCRTCVPVKL